ncbi:ADP-ribose pyrophosphatase [Escherichia coli]|uniref:ADP-ribose pyrophosphatase n=1 Tax=Escherichia coli TaxID=562 RepID=A0A485JB81_ECOLX|nr:ADP-ribose pyrophosphatase [Escherichia coli]
MIEEGESVEDVARREAIEEAGLIVKRTKPVLSFLASPGGTSGAFVNYGGRSGRHDRKRYSRSG